jgi:hypothetical protein
VTLEVSLPEDNQTIIDEMYPITSKHKKNPNKSEDPTHKHIATENRFNKLNIWLEWISFLSLKNAHIVMKNRII